MQVPERSYRALDHPFTVRSAVPGVGELLDRLLSPFRDAGQGRRTPYLIRAGRSAPLALVVGGRTRYDAASVAEVVDLVLWDVYDRAFRRAESRLVLHAAAAARRGRGVLMPGAPDAGKTTLVAGLVRAGFAYLSDEAAVFDPVTRRIHAFPRPLGMEVATLRLFPGLEDRLPVELRRTSRKTRHVPASVIRPRCVGRSSTIRLVVMPEYRSGVSTELATVSRAETLVVLARSAFGQDRFAEEGLEPMARALASADCYRLRAGRLDEAVDAVTALMG